MIIQETEVTQKIEGKIELENADYALILAIKELSQSINKLTLIMRRTNG